MAKHRFTGALNTTSFPMVSTLQSRTVVRADLDLNTRTPRNPNSTEDYSDYSIPQCCYLENVVPTGEGFQSVGYAELIAGLPATSDFDQAIVLRDEDENNFILSPSGGKNYIYTANSATWTSVNPIVGAAGKLVTRAYVNGRTFVCYQGLGVYEYDATLGTFSKLTLLGITDVELRGIGGSSNYLLAFTDLTVYWSSLIDPVDFVPSLATGAGFAIPQDVKGRITAVLGIAGGFIIYTSRNAVAAVYSNNTRAPFTFKEVSNAGGILSYEQVTSEQNSGPHYAWTTGGLQKITIQSSEPVSAEVSDFLAGKLWEYWDASRNLLTQVKNTEAEFAVKLAFISSRWLIVSYSTSGQSGAYNYALWYDLVLKRWGKLKIDHVDCFYYPYPNLFGDLTYGDLSGTSYDMLGETSYADLALGIASDPPSKRSVGFLQADGAVKIVEMDYNKVEQQQGVIVFGKFQLRRTNVMSLQQLDLEGIYLEEGAAQLQMQVYAAASIDGYRSSGSILMKKLRSGNGAARYAKRLIGLNLNVAVLGTFALSSYVLEVTEDGDR